MEREPDGTLITLIDESDGTEKEFEHLATIDYEDSTYVALVPAFMEPEEFVESDGNLVILKVIQDEKGENVFITIDDDDEFYAVYRKFESLLDEDYDFIDENAELDGYDEDDTDSENGDIDQQN